MSDGGWKWGLAGLVVGFGGGVLLVKAMEKMAEEPDGIAASVLNQGAAVMTQGAAVATAYAKEIARSAQRIKEDVEDLVAEAGEGVA